MCGQGIVMTSWDMTQVSSCVSRTTPSWWTDGGDADLDAELVGLVRLALADAFDLGSVQAVDLAHDPRRAGDHERRSLATSSAVANCVSGMATCFAMRESVAGPSRRSLARSERQLSEDDRPTKQVGWMLTLERPDVTSPSPQHTWR
jgi:hypothetical protein